MESLISVIVPVYNTEEYLENCLDSIREQSYQNIEVILIDDGSKDRSGEICDSYAQNDRRFRVLHQKSSGVSVARNAALDVAGGQYILFVDSDDWLDPRMLEILAEEADGTGTDLVMCNAYNVYQNGRRKIRYPLEDDDHKKDLYYLFLYRSGVLWNKLFGRECIGNERFDTNTRYGEDQLFLHQIIENICSVSVVEQAMYYYRVDRDGDVVSAGLNEKYLDWIAVKKVVIFTLRERGLFYEAAFSANEVAYKIDRASVSIPFREVGRYQKACKELLQMCTGDARYLLHSPEGRMQGIKQYFTYKMRQYCFMEMVLIYKLIARIKSVAKYEKS